MLSVAAVDRKARVLRNDNARAVGRAGDYFFELAADDMIPMPEGATLMRLPGRVGGHRWGDRQFVSAGPGGLCTMLPQGPGATCRTRKARVALSAMPPLHWTEIS